MADRVRRILLVRQLEMAVDAEESARATALSWNPVGRERRFKEQLKEQRAAVDAWDAARRAEGRPLLAARSESPDAWTVVRGEEGRPLSVVCSKDLDAWVAARREEGRRLSEKSGECLVFEFDYVPLVCEP